MTTVTGPSGNALMTFQASNRERPCTAVPASCKISSPGWTVSFCSVPIKKEKMAGDPELHRQQEK